MINELTKIIDNFEGNVLGIGITEDKLLDALEKNNKVTSCNLMNFGNAAKDINDKSKIKKIRIQNIKKIFKRKRVDYIICNITDIKNYTKTFIKDSIYINKNYIYVYGLKDEYDLDKLIKKYKRYNVEINLNKYNNNYVLEINTKNAKYSRIKNIWYSIIDFFASIGEAITYILTGI